MDRQTDGAVDRRPPVRVAGMAGGAMAVAAMRVTDGDALGQMVPMVVVAAMVRMVVVAATLMAAGAPLVQVMVVVAATLPTVAVVVMEQMDAVAQATRAPDGEEPPVVARVELGRDALVALADLPTVSVVDRRRGARRDVAEGGEIYDVRCTIEDPGSRIFDLRSSIDDRTSKIEKR